MAESKFRIPRVATAVMVLGAGAGAAAAAGCGDEESRSDKLAKAVCKKYAECNPDSFEEDYDSQKDCVATTKDDWKEYSDAYGKQCANAWLDYYDCVVEESCSDVDDCYALAEEAESACAEEGERED